MDIVIDLSRFVDFFNQPMNTILNSLLLYFGWIPVSFVFLYGSSQLWMYYRQNLWAEKNAKFTMLAIDVPKLNEQTPKAVENLLTYLSGAHSTNTLIDTYWNGQFQLSFSLEIVSLGGYTQFLIQTPVASKNLVESAVYSQYPDAEITEVDDYTNDFKNIRFPNDDYDLWGVELIQDSNPAYPIKLYKDFEHTVGRPESQFKDPLASFMDLCGSLVPGENLCFQIVIRPTGFDWMDKLDEEAGRILGEKKKSKQNFLNKGADMLLDSMNVLASSVMGSPESTGDVRDDSDTALKMIDLKPKQKKQIEAIHDKTSKMGYDFKMRMIYLAKKDVIDKAKTVAGFFGFIKQFKSMDLNGFKPELDKAGTSAAYFFAKEHLAKRKNTILNNFIARSMTAGAKVGLLNVEEIATVWHFPQDAVVKAPLMQKTPGKKAEAPMSLPQSELIVGEETMEPLFLDENLNEEEVNDKRGNNNSIDRESKEEEQLDMDNTFKEEDDQLNSTEKEKGTPPSNLPFA